MGAAAGLLLGLVLPGRQAERRRAEVRELADQLAQSYGDRVTFVKMDTNTNPQVPARQGILGLPTLQIFVGGDVVTSLTGGKTKAALIKALEAYL